ncbi:hypothetical protein DL96DRAFT_1559877 [Flagelloscypha sp. PMI_526]|nr:hypothetical protein DL96DRAFT_1559877 [Flagelloscypha sp. PMI_526]
MPSDSVDPLDLNTTLLQTTTTNGTRHTSVVSAFCYSPYLPEMFPTILSKAQSTGAISERRSIRLATHHKPDYYLALRLFPPARGILYARILQTLMRMDTRHRQSWGEVLNPVENSLTESVFETLIWEFLRQMTQTGEACLKPLAIEANVPRFRPHIHATDPLQLKRQRLCQDSTLDTPFYPKSHYFFLLYPLRRPLPGDGLYTNRRTGMRL